MKRPTQRIITHAVAAALVAGTFAGSAAAQSYQDLKQQIDSLQRQLDALQRQMAIEQERAQKKAPAAAPGAVRSPAKSNGYVELYGHIDVSLDDSTKGIDGKVKDGQTPSGRNGWTPALSSNLSRIGVRGGRNLGDTGMRAIFQVETQIDMTATPGTTSDNRVAGAWASRNSYIGFAGPFGAIKAGKTDAPYKLATGRMDPFSATVGDYNAIIGNTGGDNRAEFDTRLPHAVWYESPHWGAFRVNALWAPGQNRTTDNIGAAMGEPNCSGGNLPPCNDGSNGTVYSIAGIFDHGPLYATAAYELHKDVNRTGDEALGGGPAPLGSVGVEDEYGYKFAVQYKLPTRTTLNGLYERLVRKAPAADFNERTHTAYYFSMVQKFTPADDFNLAWVHVGKAPGDPEFGPVDNESNLYAIGLKHHFDRQTTVYAVYATTKNHEFAHYDLGASGHGITTDCHDENGVCFFGGHVQAFSIGATYDF
jgi:predicted porin